MTEVEQIEAHIAAEADALVAAGAARLDEHIPGWPARVDLDSLDLADCAQCVLGQLFGSYGQAPQELAGNANGRLYGFDRGVLYGGPTYADLDDAWRRLILKRRAQA